MNFAPRFKLATAPVMAETNTTGRLPENRQEQCATDAEYSHDSARVGVSGSC
jgi:hypothetical protein